jgi:hypothetical protein
VQGPIFHVPGEQAAAGAVLHQQIERQIFDEELGVVLQALLIQRMQDGVTRPVCRGAGALCHRLPVLDGLTAERALIDPAVGRAREGNAVMLQLEHCRHRLPAHVFDGILIAQPIGTFGSIVHVKTPIVAVAHIA